MKKSTTYRLAIAVVLLICICIYYKPLSFSKLLTEDCTFTLSLSEHTVSYGKSESNTVDYNDITAEQKGAILSLLEQYPYIRSPLTPFSDGNMSNIGPKLLTIYAAVDDSSSVKIVVTVSGQISINDKEYIMNNAEQFIEQITEIMK